MALSSQQFIVFRNFSKTFPVSSIPALFYENTVAACCKRQNFKRLLSTKPGSSTPAAANQSTPSVDKKNHFVTIYKMPYVRHLSVIQKIKVQQTIFTLVATPVSSYLSYNGYLPAGSGWAIGAIGVLLCGFFCTLGFFSTNVVGYVYVTTDFSTIRISYLDAWGRRQDDEFPANDLVPLSELKRSFIAPLYIKLQRYSQQHTRDFYKINLSEAAQITDQDRFTTLFGKVEL